MQLTRYAVPLLCAAAIVFACAPRRQSAAEATAASVTQSSSTSATTKKPTVKPDTVHPLASSLAVSVAGTDAKFALHVTNRGAKNLELLFTSGQTHEFVVLDSVGREVWRWSEGRMFTQAVQSKLLHVGDTETYEETWTPGTAKGRFTVVASLRTQSQPVEQRAEFVVP